MSIQHVQHVHHNWSRYLCIYMRVRTHIHIYAYIIYIYRYTYIHTYIHTHTYMNVQRHKYIVIERVHIDRRMRLRRMRTFIIAHAMYSFADEGQIIIVITTNIVSTPLGYRSPISAAEISLILDPRGIRYTRTILLYLLSHTYPYSSIHPSIPPTHPFTRHIHKHTATQHTHINPRRSFAVLASLAIIRVSWCCWYLSEIYNFRVLFCRGIRSKINRGDRADDLFSRPRKRPFLRLPRLSIFTFCPGSRS